MVCFGANIASDEDWIAMGIITTETVPVRGAHCYKVGSEASNGKLDDVSRYLANGYCKEEWPDCLVQTHYVWMDSSFTQQVFFLVV